MTGTTVLLVRHGSFDGLGSRHFGRPDGPPLNTEGQAQVQHLAQRLAGTPVAWIYTSPYRRAFDTATIVTRKLGCPLDVEPAIGEVQLGGWDMREFDELANDPAWLAYNAHRTTVAVPGGEPALAAQARAMTALLRMGSRHAGQTIVVVSHADIIRGVVFACLGAPLDALGRLVIAPASITEVVVGVTPAVIRVSDSGV